VNAGRSRLTAVAALAGTVAAAIVVAVASLRYPAILRPPGAGPMLAVTVIMLLGYGVSPWVRERVLVARRTQLNILPWAPVTG
jgi:hypothetical protein